MFVIQLFLVFCCCVSAVADALSCPWDTREPANDDGLTTGATLRIYECTREKDTRHQQSMEMKMTCGDMVKEVEINKGVLLNYDKNGYSIMVKSLDRSTCFSWRNESWFMPGCKFTCSDSPLLVLPVAYSSDLENVVRIDVVPKYSGKQRFCRMRNGIDDTVTDKIVVNAYDCIDRRFSVSGRETCNLIRKGIVVRKDELVNLNYLVNDYTVLLKFYGKELCVSSREYHVNYTDYRCRSACDDMFEKSKYEFEDGRLVISYERAYLEYETSGVETGSKYLKFQNVTNFTGNDGRRSKENQFLLLFLLTCTVTIFIKWL